MSFQESLNPLPKAFANVSFNNLICNNATINDDIIINGVIIPTLVVQGPEPSNKPLITSRNTDNTIGSFQVGISAESNSGTTVSLVAQNDPVMSALNGLWSDASLEIATFNPDSLIILSPNDEFALTCNYVSPGVTNTLIQNLTFPTLGGVASPLNYYEVYSQLLSFSGPWGATQSTILTIVSFGNSFTLKLDRMLAAGSAPNPILSDSSIPARFRPSSVSYFPSICVDNGVNVSSLCIINTTGIISLEAQNAAGPLPLIYGDFSGVGSTGFNAIYFSYVL